MRIFISWSGEPAKQVASAARTFLRTVLAGRVQPFMSDHDIEKGARFGSVLSEELGATDTGLLILTSQNQRAPWLVFEAGALSKSLVQSRVIPLVVDIEHADLTSPIGQFQDAKIADVDAMLRVVQEINHRLSEPVPDEVLAILFEAAWDGLQEAVTEALGALQQPQVKPTTDHVLAEILDGVRGVSAQQKRLATRVTSLERTIPSTDHRDRAIRDLLDPKVQETLSKFSQSATASYNTTGLAEALAKINPTSLTGTGALNAAQRQAAQVDALAEELIRSQERRRAAQRRAETAASEQAAIEEEGSAD